MSRLLERDAWYTVQELADAAGLARSVVMEQLAVMYDQGAAMLVMLPGQTRPGGVQSNSCRLLVHRAEDDRAVGDIIRLGDPYSAWKLSNSLYSSCMMKIVALVRKGELRTYAARNMAAEFVAMKRLERLRMLDRHQRPDCGFLYACSWQTVLCNVLPTRLIGGGSRFRFSVKFEGGIPIKTLPVNEDANNRTKSRGGPPLLQANVHDRQQPQNSSHRHRRGSGSTHERGHPRNHQVPVQESHSLQHRTHSVGRG